MCLFVFVFLFLFLINYFFGLKKSDVDRANEISKQIKALEEFGDETLNERKELAKERVSILLNMTGHRMHSDEYSTTLAIKELKEQLVLGKELMVQAKLSYEPAE